MIHRSTIDFALLDSAMHGIQVYAFNRGGSSFVSFFRPCVHRLHPGVRPRPRMNVPQAAPIGSKRGFASSSPVHATHRDTPPSSLLSQALDQRRQAVRDSQTETAGPFMLGTIERTGPKQKKWSELSAKGKGMADNQNYYYFSCSEVSDDLITLRQFSARPNARQTSRSLQSARV